MKIKSIEYQNFRNFEKRGKIYFDTDGKITIVYGTNGDGKTTLHQLFQWILYGRVNFNRTTSGTEPLPAKAGRFGKLLKQPKGSASQLLFFILLFSNFKVVRVTSLL